MNAIEYFNSLSPEWVQKRQAEMEANPECQRFEYLNSRYHANTATPEERKEYEDLTWWMREIDPGILMPDTAPNPWEMERPEKK